MFLLRREAITISRCVLSALNSEVAQGAQIIQCPSSLFVWVAAATTDLRVVTSRLRKETKSTATGVLGIGFGADSATALGGQALRYRVAKAFIGLLTPSLLPLESIDSTV
jgi:hypothetical protein